MRISWKQFLFGGMENVWHPLLAFHKSRDKQYLGVIYAFDNTVMIASRDNLICVLWLKTIATFLGKIYQEEKKKCSE